MAGLKIVGISGSLRAGSFNTWALQNCASLMSSGMTLHMTSIQDLPLYNPDLHANGFPKSVQTLRDEMASADGIILASPEYNWTIGAPLKNAIDWISRFPEGQQAFAQKPCAIISATPGPLGGARGQYDLRRSIGGLGALVLSKPEIFINHCKTKFDTNGKITDEPTLKIMKEQMTAFEDWIVRMKKAFQ